MSTIENYEWSLGEIRVFPFAFAPKGWASCNGQAIPIQQNQALFSLIGTQYGGNGTTNFKLPDLRGRVLLHAGNGYQVSKSGGESSHVLAIKEMAAHTHQAIGSSKPSDEGNPKHNYWPRDKPYRTDRNTKLHPNALGEAGKGRPHYNMAPYLSLNYCIAITGNYPGNTIQEDFVGAIKPFPMDKRFELYWTPCDGSYLPISQFNDLFSVIGTRYGGDGTTNFRLPDLRGRAMLGQGQGDGLSAYAVGDTGGASTVALTEAQLPKHHHAPSGKIRGGNADAGSGVVWANGYGDTNGFATEPGTSPAMHHGAIDIEGESVPHNNMMPYQVMLFSIAIRGVFPPHQ